MKFADYLTATAAKNSSHIVAGFDPRIEKIPSCFRDEAASKARGEHELIYYTLCGFYEAALEALKDKVAGIKPNIAFFEQYGLAGLQAFQTILGEIRAAKLPVIVDAKRGDIGSTAEAYANAYLASDAPFAADALTINPFLGFDTIEPFLQAAEENGRGLFVLVKTSNPGSGDLQDLVAEDKRTISQRLADWVDENSGRLQGDCGYSGLGVVVGATYPEQAKAMRERMPHAFFLIPGMGSQGGSAEQALAGFGHQEGSYGGAVVNVSRGITASFSSLEISREEAIEEVRRLALSFNDQLNQAMSSDR